EQTAPQQLATAVNEMTATAANELGPLPPAAQGLEQKHPHDVIDEQAYITRRVQPQADFHERGALDNRNKLQRWRTVGLLLAVVAAALGVIAGVQKNASINVWVAVVSTAIATLTSFIYAGRFEFFAATYFATATKLRGRLRIWQAAADKSRAELDRFILEIEAILATQNQGWVSELSKRASEELDALNKQRTAGSPGN
ncbi:MAG TPA: SLATT domain-containing protein, partial [Povalibacter sp.]|nr:SLATT domain-containing protein [Povalibacter sp.]